MVSVGAEGGFFCLKVHEASSETGLRSAVAVEMSHPAEMVQVQEVKGTEHASSST